MLRAGDVSSHSRLPPQTVIHRLAGDTSADRLLAPRYDKNRVIRAIREQLAAAADATLGG